MKKRGKRRRRESWTLRGCYFIPNDKNPYKVYDDTYNGTPALVRYESQVARAQWGIGYMTKILKTTFLRFIEGLFGTGLLGRGEVGGEGTGFLPIGKRNKFRLFLSFMGISYHNLA
jgi:hypothetical protein